MGSKYFSIQYRNNIYSLINTHQPSYCRHEGTFSSRNTSEHLQEEYKNYYIIILMNTLIKKEERMILKVVKYQSGKIIFRDG